MAGGLKGGGLHRRGERKRVAAGGDAQESTKIVFLMTVGWETRRLSS